jgi:hemolysin-activating ACP:hemolysin acyltransferase
VPPAADPPPKPDKAMDELKIIRLPDRYAALGVAAHFLARRKIFSTFGFGDMLTTIDGQVTRGHCRFVFRGNKLVAYVGYAVYDAADAASFATTGNPPPHDRASGKDVIWVLTLAATEDTALDAVSRALSHEFAGRRVMAIRLKPDGSRHLVNLKVRSRLRRAPVAKS